MNKRCHMKKAKYFDQLLTQIRTTSSLEGLISGHFLKEQPNI